MIHGAKHRNGQGVTTMNKTNAKLNAVIREIVDTYANDILLQLDTDIIINSIPNVDIDRAVAVLISDPDIAAEATGPDNPAWERYMLPALYRRFKTPNRSYVDMELSEEWTNGVRDYLLRYITPALENEIAELKRYNGLAMQLAYNRAKEITVERPMPAGY
jgi:hypothetical protein